MSTRILIGDVREQLATLPDQSVQCCVTSPPYYGLRDYGVPGQLGLEPTLAEYIATMVEVFRDVRRVLRDDGTLWLNIGDSYNAGTSAGRKPSANVEHGYWGNGGSMGDRRVKDVTTKTKDLMMVPARLAIALQDDGWYLRSDIIWAKPNPMPESVTDRPTSSHEHIFLLTKSRTYFYDADAVRSPLAESSISRLSQNIELQIGSERANGGAKTNGTMKAVGGRQWWNETKGPDYMTARDGRNDGGKIKGGKNPDDHMLGANVRNVWNIATMPYAEAHFATFPPEIPRRCIKAGSSEKGCCASCGAPYRRSTNVTYENPGNRTTNGSRSLEQRHETAGFAVRLEKRVETTGWSASCECEADISPCVVLDPFLGSGTTLLVADQLDRDGIGIELNPAYAELARLRIYNDAPLFANIA